jgi:hypothetical protein
VITVREGIAVNMRVKALVHELAHALLRAELEEGDRSLKARRRNWWWSRWRFVRDACPARRGGVRHAIDDRDLRVVEDELYPMSELLEEWRIGDGGTSAPNWVAALHRSRSGH